MISVSPPQAASPIDQEKSLMKDLGKPEASKTKADFESALKKQFEKKNETFHDHKKPSLDSEKSSRDRSEALKEKKERDDDKSTLGGTKKRVQKKVNEPMISNIMASVESEIEIPELETVQETTGEIQNTKSTAPVQTKSVDQMLNELLMGAEDVAVSDMATLESESAEAQASTAAMIQFSDVEGGELQYSEKLMNSIVQFQPSAQAVEETLLPNVQQAADVVTSENTAQLQPTAETMVPAVLVENRELSPFEKQVFDSLKRDSASADAGANLSQKLSADAVASPTGFSSFSQSSLTDSKDFGSETSTGDEPSSFTGASFNSAHAPSGASEKSFQVLAQDAQAAGPRGLEDSADSKIQQLMNKAQYLVRQGGGEMTINMSPDGQNQMQMKVLVENGQVSLQVKTNDLSLKKLVEDHLSDLKSGLAQHNLKVDAVKIDVVQATSTDNQAQFQSNLNQGQFDNRQSEAWTQFQDRLNQRKVASGTAFHKVGASTGSGSLNSPSMLAAGPSNDRTFGGLKGRQFNRVA